MWGNVLRDEFEWCPALTSLQSYNWRNPVGGDHFGKLAARHVLEWLVEETITRAEEVNKLLPKKEMCNSYIFKDKLKCRAPPCRTMLWRGRVFQYNGMQSRVNGKLKKYMCRCVSVLDESLDVLWRCDCPNPWINCMFAMLTLCKECRSTSVSDLQPEETNIQHLSHERGGNSAVRPQLFYVRGWIKRLSQCGVFVRPGFVMAFLP